LDDIPFSEECQTSNAVHEEGFHNVEIFVPTIGMCFASANEAKTFYRQYAIRKGFGIRTRPSKKEIDHQIRYFILVCSRVSRPKITTNMAIKKKEIKTNEKTEMESPP